jgi:hypothetical protein
VVAPVLNKPVLTVTQPQQVVSPTTTTFLAPQPQYVAVPVPVQPVLAAAGFPSTIVTSLPPPAEVCLHCSELSSGLYCRVQLQYNPEDSSEHHTRRRENLKSHTFVSMELIFQCLKLNFTMVPSLLYI